MWMTEGRAHTPDGAELFWTSTGEGSPLLLVAGQASDHRGWLHVVPALAQHHRVVLYDHRGVGRSTAGASDTWTTRTFADDAAVVLEACDIDLAHVYGHSMGGRVAQRLAVDHPEAVELFFVRDAPLRVRRRHFEASRSHDAWDDLHRIVAPTLVLHGADDPVTSPDSGISLALRIPTADLLLVPDQLHCPHLESADGADAVLDFLADG